jgi:hypothetical protein
MVDAVWLAGASADFYVVWETRLYPLSAWNKPESAILDCLTWKHECVLVVTTYPHSRVQRAGDVVVLLQSGAAPQNLRKPELADGAFHVADLALHRRRCFHPL